MTTKKRSKVRFPQPLANAGGLLWDGWTDQNVFAEYQNQEAQADKVRLDTLCQERGIAPSSEMYFQLALELAREAYPAPKPRGRKKAWNDFTLGALVVAVELKLKSVERAMSDVWACTEVAKTEPWNSFARSRSIEGEGVPAEVLRVAYKSFKGSPRANLMRHAHSLYELDGRLTEWELLVKDFLNRPLVEK
jgi:hypothetical protein